MSRSCRARACAVTVLCAGLACCAPASASTGGALIPALIPPSLGTGGYGEPGKRSVLVAPTALVGEAVTVRGTFPGAARRRVVLQRLDPRKGWRTVARSRVHSTSRLLVRWRADRSGRIGLRVVRARRPRGAPVAYVTLYRPAQATFYGEGLFGNKTYCGQTMTPLLLGVAHRRLPCGTQVAIVYERREIVVPVVDRGPFDEGYAWDLTQATADALGFRVSGAIGYVRVAPQPA